MKTGIVTLALFCSAAVLFGQATSFTYQGRLTDNGATLSGNVDLTFTLYTAPSGGSTVGASNVISGSAISNGLFTVTLDFGAPAFDGSARWLEIGVRPGGSAGAYTRLLPRQAIQAAPYAVRAANFSGAVTTAQLPPTIARLDASEAFSGSLQLTNPANIISGNGVGLTNLSLASLGPNGTVAYDNSGNFEPVMVVSADFLGGGDTSMADMNSDGLQDFVLARGVETPLVMITQPRARSFAAVALGSLVTAAAKDYRGLMAADLNGDGRTDLIAYDRNSKQVIAFLAGTTFPSFTLFSSVTLNADATDPFFGGTAMAVGDVNGDGRSDVVIANPSSNVVYIVTNQVGTLFLASTLTVGQGPRNIALGDLNGDGRLDFVTVNSGSNTVTVATNAGGGRYAIMSQLSCTNPAGLVLADFNGDGRLDIAAASESSLNEIKVWTNGGSGQMTLSWSLPGASYATHALAAGDFDGDGILDLLASAAYDPAIGDPGPVFFPGLRDGRFTTFKYLNANSLYGSSRLFAADLDKNGKADITLAYNSRVITWLNKSEIAWNGISTFNDQVIVHERLDVEGDTYLSGATHIGGIQGGLSVQGGINMVDGSPLRVTLSPGPKWGQDLYNGFGISYGLQVSSNGFSPNVFYFRTAPDFLSGAFAWYIGGYWGQADPAFNPSGGIIGMTLDASGLSVPRDLTVGGGTVFHGPTRFESNIVFAGASAANPILIQPPSALSFGSSTRQMLNLYDTFYGIGVQSSRMYFRTGPGPNDGFAWFKNGTHSNNPDDPGTGGSSLMRLTTSGLVLGPGMDQGGSIELGDSVALGVTPYIDFHYGVGVAQDYNVRLINDGDHQLTVNGDERITGNLRFNTGALRQMVDLWNGEHAMGVQAWATYFRTIGGAADGAFVWYKGGVHNDNQYNPGGGTELMRLNAGGLTVRGTFVSSSDRDVKAGFAAVDPKAILEKVAVLPISQWHFTNDAATPHIGPVAQDFYAAFNLGADDKHIAMVDADGIALAAIKGLNQKVEEQAAELKERDAAIIELRKLVTDLKQQVEAISRSGK